MYAASAPFSYWHCFRSFVVLYGFVTLFSAIGFNVKLSPFIDGMAQSSPAPLPTCTNAFSSLLPGSQPCSNPVAKYDPLTGDVYFICTDAFFTDTSVMRLTPNRTIIPYLDHPTCQFATSIAGDWQSNTVYVVCEAGSPKFAQIESRSGNVTMLVVPSLGSILFLEYSEVTQTLYGTMFDKVFTYRGGIFSQLSNQNVTIQGNSEIYHSCSCITRNEKLGKLFMVCQVRPITGPTVIMYDEALDSTSLVYPRGNSSQCLLTFSFTQGFVFDNSGEYLFLPCNLGIQRLHIASGSLVPYYQSASKVNVVAMAVDPITNVLFATIGSTILALTASGNPIQVASTILIPLQTCTATSLLVITDDSLLASCIGKVGITVLANTYTFTVTGSDIFNQILPVQDGSGDAYAISQSGMWRMHNAQLVSLIPNATYCRPNRFEIISLQPLQAFISCGAGVILLLQDGEVTSANVTTSNCVSPVGLAYQADTDQLFYLCSRINSLPSTGGIFRIPNAFQQFPTTTFTEQRIANQSMCDNPEQLKTYGYDSVTKEFFLLATCPGTGLLRFHFHPDQSFDVLTIPPPTSGLLFPPEFNSMVLDESDQVMWVTSSQDPYCLWRFSLSNLLAPPVSVVNGSQCFRIDIDKERNKILVASFQDGILSVDPMTGAVEVLLSSDICEFPGRSLAWSPLDSITYVGCGSTGTKSIVAISNHFRCATGFEWRGGICNPCSAGYYRSTMSVNSTVNETMAWSCLPAPLGAFVPAATSADFQLCPAGTYSNGVGSSMCTPCAMGTASNITGRTTVCDSCPPGSSAGQIGQTSCDICPKQFYSSIAGSPSCSYCSEQVTLDRTACLSHVCNRNQEYVYAQGVCVECSLGSQSPQGLACQQCPPSWYTPAKGQDCISCDYDTEGLSCSNGIASVRSDHWAFLVPVNQSVYGIEDCENDATLCVFRTATCPVDSCPGGALQLLPSADPDSNSTTQLHYCDFPRVDSFSNTMCGAAVAGYIPWGHQIVRCDPAVTPNGGVVFGLLILSIVLVAFLLRGGSSSAGTVSVLLYFAQITALEVGDWSKWLTWMQFANFRPTSATQQCLANWTPYEQLVAELLMPLFLLAILVFIGCVHYSLSRVLFHQPTSDSNRASVTMSSSHGASQPVFASCLRHMKHILSSFDIYRYFGGSLSILLFCYVQVSVSCFEWLNCVSVGQKSVVFSLPTVDCYSSQYRSHRGGVIAVIALYVIGFPVSIFLFLFRHRHRIQLQERKAEQNEISQLRRSAHAATASAAREHASPVSVNHPSTTIRERMLDQSASDSFNLEPTSSSAFRSSSSSTVDSFTACCGPLYLPYRRSSWFYQPLTLVRRAILVLIAVFVISQPAEQFMMFGFVHLISLIVHINVQPFISAHTNAAESLSTYSLIFLSITLNGASRPYPVFVEVLSFLFIVPPLILLFAFTVYHRWRELGLNVQQLLFDDDDNAKATTTSTSPKDVQQQSIHQSQPAPSSFSHSMSTNSDVQQHRQQVDHLDRELEVDGSVPMSDLRSLTVDHEVANL